MKIIKKEKIEIFQLNGIVEDKKIKAKEIGKNKKIVISIIAGLCFIFITYNLFLEI